MENDWISLGTDPLFPGCGEFYKVDGCWILDDIHGGKFCRSWLKENFEAKEDDVYIVSYPKTGSTWTQEMAYIIRNGLDSEEAKTAVLEKRSPYLENKVFIERGWIPQESSHRLLKSHYPYSLLPKSVIDKKCKIIYTMRNPKDTVVSYYPFAIYNKSLSYQGDFPTFFNYFIEDKLPCGPYWKHLLEFWERRNEDNILVLQYEEMKKDPSTSVRQIAKFLGKQLTEDEVKRVVDHCSFENMKTNPTVNKKDAFGDKFMRKGQVGDWKNHFTDDMNKRMEDYIKKHFEGTGLNFTC